MVFPFSSDIQCAEAQCELKLTEQGGETHTDQLDWFNSQTEYPIHNWYRRLFVDELAFELCVLFFFFSFAGVNQMESGTRNISSGSLFHSYSYGEIAIMLSSQRWFVIYTIANWGLNPDAFVFAMICPLACLCRIPYAVCKCRLAHFCHIILIDRRRVKSNQGN